MEAHYRVNGPDTGRKKDSIERCKKNYDDQLRNKGPEPCLGE